MTEQLILIGNGFDRHHGVLSGYEHFRAHLLKTDRSLLAYLDSFITCKNLWGDFEYNLASLSREGIMEWVDCWLPKLDEEEERFRYSDYESALDQASQIVMMCTKGLKYRFHKWIRSVYLPKGHKGNLLNLDRNATFITFNYTDFLESLYGIPSEQIIYLHGNKHDPVGSLTLGHGSDPERNLEEWVHKNQHKKRFRPFLKNKQGHYFPNSRLSYLAYFHEVEETGNWGYPIRYYAVDRVIGEIEGYFRESAKTVSQVLKKQEDQLLALKDVKKIIVMGHSLSQVDWPYFKHIQQMNTHPCDLAWEISYYSEDDRLKIDRFAHQMGIDPSSISRFRLEDRQIKNRAPH